MSVRGKERSRKRYAVRDDERRPRRGRPDYNETPVDGRALHEVKKFYSSNLCVSVDRTNGICTCNFLVRFMFPRRPTERHIHTFSTAELQEINLTA